MPVEEGKCRRANLLKRKASSDFAALSGPARPETAADRVPCVGSTAATAVVHLAASGTKRLGSEGPQQALCLADY